MRAREVWRMGLFAAGLSGAATASAQTMSADAVAGWRADLTFAADSLPRAHPNFFHTVSRETYRAALDSLSARVPALEAHQIVVELARIVAMVGDGHTRVTFPFDSSAGFFTGHSTTAPPRIPGLVFRHYPIRFGLFADTLWVVRADSAHRELLGTRVVRLGERSVAEAIAAVAPTVQHDNPSQVRDLLPTWLVCPEVLHARGVIADREHASIVAERSDGSLVTSPLSPVPPGSRVDWIDGRPSGTVPLSERFPRRAHWFTRLGAHTFYARYREVRDDPGDTVAEFADSLFDAIAAAGADRLVLDLRGNVGGNGSLNRPLLQRLIRAERLWRPGGLWALIDRGTFSAAVMMAADLESRTPTLLVGEKTGGDPNGYGDSRRRLLPNSGITVRVSSLYWQLTGPQDPRDGIAPHVAVDPRFADWRDGRDPALEAAVARANAKTDLAGSWHGEIGWQFARLPIDLDLTRRSAGWSGRVRLPAAGVADAPLADPRVSPGGIRCTWLSDGEPWRFEGTLAGQRLVGVIRYHGLDYAAVLQRAAPAPPTSTRP